MKKISAILIFIINCLISTFLIYKKLYSYSIISITINILLLIYLIKYLIESKNPQKIYEKELKTIIKTFEPILVDVEKIPDLQVKNLIIVSSFEKMIDIQYELKKPILYKKSLNSCAFFLLDTEIIYVFILRIDDDSFSPVDDVIESIELNNKKRQKDKKILDDIDKTTIIKLDDFREFKVSPIRKKDLTLIEETNIEYTILKSEENKAETNFTKENEGTETPDNVENITTGEDANKEQLIEEKIIKKRLKRKNHATERARKYREKQRKRK